MSKLKVALTAGLLALSSISLAGCAPNTLEIDCNATIENVKAFEVPESAEWRFWPSGYASLNAGSETRQSVKASIQALYPGAQELVEKAEVAHTREENNQEQFPPITDAAANAYILEQSAKDNKTFTVDFSDDEWSQIFAGDGSVISAQGAFIDLTGDAKQTCSSIKSIEKTLGDNPNYFFNDVVNDAQSSFMVLQEIHQCDLYGKFGDFKCAGQDFVMDSSGGIEPTQRNPFLEPYGNDTTQGLAEFTWCYNQGLSVNSSRTGCE
jgi:hypothetical protein